MGTQSTPTDPLAAIKALQSVQSDAQSSGKNFVDYVNEQANAEKYKDQIKQALWSKKFGDIPMDENAFNKTSDGTIYLKPDYTPQQVMG